MRARVVESKAVLVAPGLLWFELASVCLKKMRAHPGLADNILAAFNLLQQLSIESVAVDDVEVVRLALQEDLTTHDASYLWLARRLGVDLVTLDRSLLGAAGRGS